MSTSNATRDAKAGRETETRRPRTPRGPGSAASPSGALFTDGVTHPFDAIEWELRTAAITNEKGEVFFEQKDVEVPKSWSMTATNIVAQKYFHGKPGTPQRERSVRQLIGRVVDTITGFGRKDGYFRTAADRDAFSDELAHILVNQAASFNSPVWFNVGVEPKPQASACFINSVGDSMSSILDLAKTEGMLFKFGSGTGSNLSSPPLLDRVALLGRHRLGPRLLHEGLRQLRGRDQVGRQDAPRREDGHPERRPPRHRGVHRLQGEGREEGLGPHRRRLGRLLQRRGLQQHRASRTRTTPSA